MGSPVRRDVQRGRDLRIGAGKVQVNVVSRYSQSQGQRTGTSETISSSMYSRKLYVPSGIAANIDRTRCSTWSSRAVMDSLTVSMPNLAINSCTLRSHELTAATMALISPQFISGMRLLSRNTVNRAWLTTPASKSLTGLRRVDADVVIHMDGHLAPQRHVVGHAVVRLQLR